MLNCIGTSHYNFASALLMLPGQSLWLVSRHHCFAISYEYLHWIVTIRCSLIFCYVQLPVERLVMQCVYRNLRTISTTKQCPHKYWLTIVWLEL